MTLIWHWPQLVWLALVAMSIGIAVIKHGDARRPYSMWDTLISTVLAFGLLYFGGFWAGASP